MIISFDILFRVRLRHSFYADGAARHLMVLPTAETLRLIDNNKLLFRITESGFLVAAESVDAGPAGSDTSGSNTTDGDATDNGATGADNGQRTERKLRRALPDGARFRFHLVSTSTRFSSITNLPLTDDEPGAMLLGNRNGSTDDEALLLHPSQFAGMESNSFAILKDNALKYTVSDQTIPGTATVRTAQGRVLLTQTTDPQDDTLYFSFDMTGFPSDFYTLWFGNKAINTWYHAAERYPGMLLAVVEIDPGSGAAVTHRMFDGQQIMKQPEYEIRFQNRSTFWRYHIRNRSGVNLNNPVILAAPYSFSKKNDDELPEDALLFESEQAIPLQEAGISNISLRRQTGAATHLVLDTLPNPGTRFAEPDPVDHNKLYSDIFITL